MPVLTYALLGVNVLVSLWAFSAFKQGDRIHRFVFIPAESARGRNLIGILLSQFSHSDMGHLFFNMITLFIFGPIVEQHLGLHMLSVYVLSGLAALLLVFLIRRNNPQYRVLGASGSIVGILFAAIVLQPDMKIFFLIVPLPIPAPAFAVIYLLLSSYLLNKEMGNVSHEAHLGGGLAGLGLAGWLSQRGFSPLVERARDLFN